MARKRKRTKKAQPDTTARVSHDASIDEQDALLSDAVPSDPALEADSEAEYADEQPGGDFEQSGSIPAPSASFDESFDLPEGEQLTREERIERVERSQARRRHKKIVRRIVWALVGLVAAAIVAACVAFALLRWETYDDTADFTGQWRIVGTDKVIEVTEDTIVLTDDVAYRYTVDAQAKTITFKFGNMVGNARYRFSLDRQLLSITDGEFDWWTTLCDDVPWTIAALFTQLIGDGAQLSPGSGTFVTELTRDLDPSNDPAPADAAADADAGADAGAASDAGTLDDPADPADSVDGGEPDPSSEDAGAEDDPTSASSSASSSGTRDVDALDISDLGANA